MTKPEITMSSKRPYLLRAIFDWINDNNFTPFLLVDATAESVLVPQGYVKDGQIVLNISMSATQHLELGNDEVSFKARFSGVSHTIRVPIDAVLAIYARENGQGMIFPVEQNPEPAAHQLGTKPRRDGASDGVQLVSPNHFSSTDKAIKATAIKSTINKPALHKPVGVKTLQDTSTAKNAGEGAEKSDDDQSPPPNLGPKPSGKSGAKLRVVK